MNNNLSQQPGVLTTLISFPFAVRLPICLQIQTEYREDEGHVCIWICIIDVFVHDCVSIHLPVSFNTFINMRLTIIMLLI